MNIDNVRLFECLIKNIRFFCYWRWRILGWFFLADRKATSFSKGNSLSIDKKAKNKCRLKSSMKVFQNVEKTRFSKSVNRRWITFNENAKKKADWSKSRRFEIEKIQKNLRVSVNRRILSKFLNNTTEVNNIDSSSNWIFHWLCRNCSIDIFSIECEQKRKFVKNNYNVNQLFDVFAKFSNRFIIDFLKSFELEDCNDNRRKKKLELIDDEKASLTNVIAKKFPKSKIESLLQTVLKKTRKKNYCNQLQTKRDTFKIVQEFIVNRNKKSKIKW